MNTPFSYLYNVNNIYLLIDVFDKHRFISVFTKHIIDCISIN